MKKLNAFKRWSTLLIPIMLFTFIASVNSPELKEEKYEVISSKLILDAPTMCVPFNKFDFEFENAIAPVAPYLKPAWGKNYPITTSSPEAQEFFNQGLFYLYAFNHAEAARAFKEAARLDSKCAMCYWGVALALGPNINRPMPEEHFADTYSYSQKALSLSKKATKKEQALVKALTNRYEEKPSEDRAALDLAYANEMRFCVATLSGRLGHCYSLR